MTIHVVGGVYAEYCARPTWKGLYGSGGRAAMALASMQTPVQLHSYFTQPGVDQFRVEAAWFPSLEVSESIISETVRFRYLHDLSTPHVSGRPDTPHASLTVTEDKVVRFGMVEGDAVVSADWAVYDPQNMGAATPFRRNGSVANHLALVLNAWEAQSMANSFGKSPEHCASIIASQESAEVVIIKMGPRGALVWTSGECSTVPAYRTSNVWKIGSGDCFVAHFANGWMYEARSPHDAADAASRATAYYCERRMLPDQTALTQYSPSPIGVSPSFAAGEKPTVYLAGPFFDLAQLWVVEEAGRQLRAMGLNVFSPFHDIGLGSAEDVVPLDLEAINNADIVFAVVDGLDAGTVYEVGYARARGKPVVVYSEREKEESLKMMEGSGCVMARNFATAIYSTLWEAASL